MELSFQEGWDAKLIDHEKFMGNAKKGITCKITNSVL